MVTKCARGLDSRAPDCSRDRGVVPVLGPAVGRRVEVGVAGARVGAGVQQRPRGVEVAALGGEVQRRHALAVRRPTEGRAAARVGAELDEPPDGGGAPARRGPHQRAAPVDVGVGARAARDEGLEDLDAIAARRPGERLVEDLLRIVRRAPVREAAVRAVVGAVRAGLGRQAPVGCDELFDEVQAAEARRGAQVARVHAVLGQDLGDLAMAPEERDDERRAAVAARGHVDGGALVDQHPRQQREVGVARLVQRRPPVGVAARRVGARVEQDAHEALVARRAGHPDEVVAVGADRRGQIGEGLELRAQAVDVVGLDRAIGAGERLARVAQAARRGGAAPPSSRSRAGARPRRAHPPR